MPEKKPQSLLDRIGNDSRWSQLEAAIKQANERPLPPHPPSAKGI